MTPKRFMVVAGEPSGDTLAAEIVHELRRQLATRNTYSKFVQPFEADLAPVFFGAGGPRMAEAGVKLEFDLAKHSVVGLIEVIKNYFKFRNFRNRLVALAANRLPDAIILVDFSVFNHSLAAAIRRVVGKEHGPFCNWRPLIVKYNSPQVWASREGRIYNMERDFDLLLSIFPFEKDWYARRVPRLKVEYVGHPIRDRYRGRPISPGLTAGEAGPIKIVLLPGSRRSEIKQHLPIMLGAFAAIQAQLPKASATLILPNQEISNLAGDIIKATPQAPSIVSQIGGLPETLASAHLAIASTGTVTMECAYFGVPAVTLYKGSWIEYQIAKKLIRVKWLTMPNILADEPLFPEFLQYDATVENIANASLSLLKDVSRIAAVRGKLAGLMDSLGPPGAASRAAKLILDLLDRKAAGPVNRGGLA